VKCERRAAARTFPVRAVASSSTSSFAPLSTSSSERAAGELDAGAEFDFESDFGADSDFGTGKASTSLRVPQATPALLRTCFSRSISAVAREIKPVP